MDELKGRLTIIKPNDCKQIIKISRNAYREMDKYGIERVFWGITDDLRGIKWIFEKID